MFTAWIIAAMLKVKLPDGSQHLQSLPFPLSHSMLTRQPDTAAMSGDRRREVLRAVVAAGCISAAGGTSYCIKCHACR
jgi:hypothetical protein